MLNSIFLFCVWHHLKPKAWQWPATVPKGCKRASCVASFCCCCCFAKVSSMWPIPKKKTIKLSNTNVGFLSLVSQVVGFMYVGGCKASCRECRMVKVNEENDTSDLLYHEMTHGHCDFLGGKRWCVKSGRGVRVTHLLLEKSYFCVSFLFEFCRVGFHALDHEFPLGLWGIFRVEISFCSEYVPVCPKWNQFLF